ncbi:MAG: hypothetical protein LBD68_05070 [Zoogloeaceae bacterium]|jgi:hypothetical protein|nr:hypothetical protein [Zoogloeaceae bacterium]
MLSKTLLFPPVLDYTPYHFALLGLFLAMGGYVFAAMIALRQFLRLSLRRSVAWLALSAGLLVLLRQSWARLEFTLATGVYDLVGALYEVLAVGFLALAILRFAANDVPASPKSPPP